MTIADGQLEKDISKGGLKVLNITIFQSFDKTQLD